LEPRPSRISSGVNIGGRAFYFIGRGGATRLNATDLKCLDLARARRTLHRTHRGGDRTDDGGPTSVIDRLEARGIVRRERDIGDRRKVFVRRDSGTYDGNRRLFESLDRAMRQLYADYPWPT